MKAFNYKSDNLWPTIKTMPEKLRASLTAAMNEAMKAYQSAEEYAIASLGRMILVDAVLSGDKTRLDDVAKRVERRRSNDGTVTFLLDGVPKIEITRASDGERITHTVNKLP